MHGNHNTVTKVNLPVMVVHVTWDDIENGGHECSRCPLARAIARVTGAEVCVGVYSFSLMYGFRVRRYYLPQRALKFLEYYDSIESGPIHALLRWWYVRPFSFHFELKPVEGLYDT
jgi:hypothetical protein